MINVMKKGFTLIELMVVVAISSFLLLAVSDFLIFTIQRNNQITVDNQVRSEANSLMDSVSRDIRSSFCECQSANSISLYGSSDCDCLGASGPTPYASYSVNGTLDLQRNSTVLNSTAVKVQYCSSCGCAAPAPGLIITKPNAAIRSYVVNLSLRQAQDNPRSDFCGRVQVQQTVSPRNK